MLAGHVAGRGSLGAAVSASQGLELAQVGAPVLEITVNLHVPGQRVSVDFAFLRAPRRRFVQQARAVVKGAGEGLGGPQQRLFEAVAQMVLHLAHELVADVGNGQQQHCNQEHLGADADFQARHCMAARELLRVTQVDSGRPRLTAERRSNGSPWHKPCRCSRSRRRWPEISCAPA